MNDHYTKEEHRAAIAKARQQIECELQHRGNPEDLGGYYDHDEAFERAFPKGEPLIQRHGGSSEATAAGSDVYGYVSLREHNEKLYELDDQWSITCFAMALAGFIAGVAVSELVRVFL